MGHHHKRNGGEIKKGTEGAMNLAATRGTL
jgi:hypothetical protein